MIIPSWKTHSKKLHTLMSSYSRITTMDINMAKTIAIHLGDTSNQPTPLASEPQHTWAQEGRYLGFMVGLAAVGTSWSTPITKFNQEL